MKENRKKAEKISCKKMAPRATHASSIQWKKISRTNTNINTFYKIFIDFSTFFCTAAASVDFYLNNIWKVKNADECIYSLSVWMHKKLSIFGESLFFSRLLYTILLSSWQSWNWLRAILFRFGVHSRSLSLPKRCGNENEMQNRFRNMKIKISTAT